MALIDRVTGIMYCGDDEEIFMDILGMYVELVSESRQLLAEALLITGWRIIYAGSMRSSPIPGAWVLSLSETLPRR